MYRAELKEPTQFGSVSGSEIQNLPFSHSGIVSVSVRTKRTNLIWFCIWFRDPKYLYRSQPCLFHMRYGSPLCSRKWLCGSPKYWGHLHEAGTTPKYANKIHLLYNNQGFFISRYPTLPSFRWGMIAYWTLRIDQVTVQKVQVPLGFCQLTVYWCFAYCRPKPPFLKVRFLWPGSMNLKFSKWPKFNNWHTFSWNITDLIHLRPH